MPMPEKASKKICIHQPDYLPWLGFFHKINLCDMLVVLDDCQLSKGSWTCRVYIAADGVKRWLTVPIFVKNRSGQLIKDVRICSETNWNIKHMKTIAQFYMKGAFFKELEDLLSPVFEKKYDFLLDLNMDFITRLLEFMSIDREIKFSSEVDCRKSVSTERLVNIIKASESDTYICGMGSSGYLKPELFENEGIKLYYQIYETFEYAQFNTDHFIPGLSIIDTIANIGREGVKRLLETNNELNVTILGKENN